MYCILNPLSAYCRINFDIEQVVTENWGNITGQVVHEHLAPAALQGPSSLGAP